MNRIEKAINIFLDAINNGTLAKGTCIGCAVGNLVAYGMNGVIYKENESFKCNKLNSLWSLAFMTNSDRQIVDPKLFEDTHVLECVLATDFTIDELMKIEYAFEKNTKILYTDYSKHTPDVIRNDQINGLAAVIKVMETFDNIESNKYVDEFTTKAKLIKNVI